MIKLEIDCWGCGDQCMCNWINFLVDDKEVASLSGILSPEDESDLKELEDLRQTLLSFGLVDSQEKYRSAWDWNDQVLEITEEQLQQFIERFDK